MGALSSASPTVPKVDPAQEKRLARVAKLAEDYKNERDALIVMAFIDGAGVREIARAVGMTHPAVKYIIDKNAENPAIVEEQRRRDSQRTILQEAKRQREERYRREQDRQNRRSRPLDE